MNRYFYFSILIVISTCLQACEARQKHLKVLAFGDSGSCSDPIDPSTCKQNEIARSMKAVCDEEGCDMGIMLGDNIYELGVESENDDQFRYKYEYHYAPLSMPIYGAIGNHDLWGLNTTAEQQIQAQVNYSKHSTTWRMHAEYYDYVQEGVHFFVINSVDFSPAQARWLSDALLHSTANWKVVYGHYPIHSNGYHGDTFGLVDQLLPIVCEYADLYVAAHDHDLQLLDSDCGVPLVVSGASGKTRFSNTADSAARRRWSVSETYGFARLEFKPKSFKVLYYNGTGEELYSRTYNRLFRLRLKGEPSDTARSQSVYVDTDASAGTNNAPKIGLLPLTNGRNTSLGAVWTLERFKKYVRIKNRFTKEYLHANNDIVETSPESATSPVGANIRTWRSAQWELISPLRGVVYLKNRGRGSYLTLGAEGTLGLTEEPSEVNSGWVFNPVDWTHYD